MSGLGSWKRWPVLQGSKMWYRLLAVTDWQETGGLFRDQLCQQHTSASQGLWGANQSTADHLRIQLPQEKLPPFVSHGPHIYISYCGYPDTDHPQQRQQLGFRSRTQGLYSPELAWFLGSGQEEVVTVLQPRSHELHGKNVNEDTILNVDWWVLCEPLCSEWSRKTRPACPFRRHINKAVLRQRVSMFHACNDSSQQASGT